MLIKIEKMQVRPLLQTVYFKKEQDFFRLCLNINTGIFFTKERVFQRNFHLNKAGSNKKQPTYINLYYKA
jgi:hypothetical protein